MKARFGPEDHLWVVLDPTPVSELGDIHFEASLAGLELQFRGGLSMDRRPTLFVHEKDARREAMGRLAVQRAARALGAYVAGGWDLSGAHAVVIQDDEGLPIFEGDL